MKKLVCMAAIVLSQISYADSSILATLYPFYEKDYLPINTDGTFESHHEFDLYNTTNVQQGAEVCYDIVTCDNYPQWLRSTHECTSYYLSPGESKHGNKDLTLVVNYPFTGICSYYARTEVKGYSPQMTVDRKTFEVK